MLLQTPISSTVVLMLLTGSVLGLLEQNATSNPNCTTPRPFGYFYPNGYEQYSYDPYSASTFTYPQYQYGQYPSYVQLCRINYMYCVGNYPGQQQPIKGVDQWPNYGTYNPTSTLYGYQFPCHVPNGQQPNSNWLPYGWPQRPHGSPNYHYNPHQSGFQPGAGSYSSSIRYPCGYYPPTFQIRYNPQPSQQGQEPVFLGRGRVEKFQGRDAELTCAFNDPTFKVVSNTAWVKINGPYDYRQPYPPYECQDPCTLAYINAMEDFRYRVITIGATSILRIYEVQPKDFGIYRCTATGERTDGSIRTLYQVVDFTS